MGCGAAPHAHRVALLICIRVYLRPFAVENSAIKDPGLAWL